MTASLAGRRLLLVRPVDEGRAEDGLLIAMQAAGAAVAQLASTCFAPPADAAALARARTQLAAGGVWDWVVFTSPRAVAALAPDGGRPWPGIRVAAVGPATAAALAAAGQTVALTGGAGADALGRALADRLSSDARVLLPAGDLAGRDLETALVAAGARVERLEAYRTLPRPLTEADLAALRPAPDAIVFTSGSGAAALLDALRTRGCRLPEPARIVGLGPRTARDLASLGLTVHAISPSADGTALVGALAAALAASQPTEPAVWPPPRSAASVPTDPRGF